MANQLERGDRFLDFVLPHSDGHPVQLYSRVGGRPVLVLLGEDASALESAVSRYSSNCEVVCVTKDVSGRAGEWFEDATGEVLGSHLDSNVESVAYLLDANLRVVKTFIGTPPNELDRLLAERGREESARFDRTVAPVLMIENVLEQDRCAFLMRLWEQAGAIETGVEMSTGEGRGEVVGASRKSRRDHTVDDPKLVQLLTQSVGRRILPEIERAFVYRPTRFEGFKIACYESESSGHFGAHRDNLSPATAHRRLAVSVNLNAGYTGGELRFPEFGSDRFAPPAGGSLVFSCAHLHEVLPVTQGRRFTLLTFLYDESTKRERVVDPFDL